MCLAMLCVNLTAKSHGVDQALTMCSFCVGRHVAQETWISRVLRHYLDNIGDVDGIFDCGDNLCKTGW